MDKTMYEQIKDGIHATCSTCARKLAALNVVFGIDAAVPGEERTAVVKAIVKKDKTVKIVDEGNAENFCSICRANRIRSDNAGCPTCGRRVCKECKAGGSSTRAGHCVECAKKMPDTRSGNGGARPNSGPAKKVKTGKKEDDVRPAPGQKCESCKGDKAVVKCASCAKMICGGCCRQLNGNCTECAAVESVR